MQKITFNLEDEVYGILSSITNDTGKTITNIVSNFLIDEFVKILQSNFQRDLSEDTIKMINNYIEQKMICLWRMFVKENNMAGLSDLLASLSFGKKLSDKNGDKLTKQELYTGLIAQSSVNKILCDTPFLRDIVIQRLVDKYVYDEWYTFEEYKCLFDNCELLVVNEYKGYVSEMYGYKDKEQKELIEYNSFGGFGNKPSMEEIVSKYPHAKILKKN